MRCVPSLSNVAFVILLLTVTLLHFAYVHAAPSPTRISTPKPSKSVSPTPKHSKSATPTPKPSKSNTPTPSTSVTPTPTASKSASPTPTPSPSLTPTPTASPSSTPSESPTPTPQLVIDNFLRHHLVTRYAKWHRKNRRKAPRLVVRFNATSPGVGDRFSSLVSAFIIASFSDRVLLLDWIQPYPLHHFFSPSSAMPAIEFTDADRREEQRRADSRYVCGRSCTKKLHLGHVLGSKHFVIYPEGATTSPQHLVAHFSTTHPQLALSKVFANLTDVVANFHVLSAVFNAMLKPAAPLKKLLEKRKRALKQSFIGVHARLGTGLGETGPRFGSSHSPEQVAKCFVKSALASGDIHGIRKYYLATDTVPFRDAFEQVLLRERSNASLIRFDDILPVHTKGCQNNASECAGTMMELIVLSKSSYIVASKSSFSRVAGYIGNVTVESLGVITQCIDSYLEKA